jgi:hypothetical protein
MTISGVRRCSSIQYASAKKFVNRTVQTLNICVEFTYGLIWQLPIPVCRVSNYDAQIMKFSIRYFED